MMVMLMMLMMMMMMIHGGEICGLNALLSRHH
jgi:hypothetical protein